MLLLGFGRALRSNLSGSLLGFTSLLSARAAPGTDSSQYKYGPERHSFDGPFGEKPNTIGLCGDIPKRAGSSLRQE